MSDKDKAPTKATEDRTSAVKDEGLSSVSGGKLNDHSLGGVSGGKLSDDDLGGVAGGRAQQQ